MTYPDLVLQQRLGVDPRFRLRHNEGRIRAGLRGRQKKVYRDRHLGAGLEREEAAERAVSQVDVVHRVEDGGAWDFRSSADDDLANLALGVDQKKLEALLSHGAILLQNRSTR